jgi:hypothetical protein
LTSNGIAHPPASVGQLAKYEFSWPELRPQFSPILDPLIGAPDTDKVTVSGGLTLVALAESEAALAEAAENASTTQTATSTCTARLITPDDRTEAFGRESDHRAVHLDPSQNSLQ